MPPKHHRGAMLAVGALGIGLGLSLGCELVLGLGNAKDRPDASDAALPDVRDAGGPHDAHADARADARADVQVGEGGPECHGDASQCACDTPQNCVAGMWQSQKPCTPGTDCIDGTCVCQGAWCNGRFGNIPSTCVKGVPVNGAICAGSTPACDLSGCVAVLPSCTDGGVGAGFNCGSDLTQNCCIMRPVSGGTFFRSYDGVSPGYTSQAAPATVSGFMLAGLETTVGRFRSFVAAWSAGWRPASGSGKHSQAHGGAGLAVSGSPGMHETGWQSSWNTEFPTTTSDWDTALLCNATFGTWTPTAMNNERLPINCINWYEAYAFCIWDGGFLPTEAEWNYAASDGCSQRVYPWSLPPTSTLIDYNHASYNCNGGACTNADIVADGQYFSGLGQWLQAEMSGNVAEWTLDYYVDPYPSGACVDCASLSNISANQRVIRGGSFNSMAPNLLSSARYADQPVTRLYSTGFRCAAPLK